MSTTYEMSRVTHSQGNVGRLAYRAFRFTGIILPLRFSGQTSAVSRQDTAMSTFLTVSEQEKRCITHASHSVVCLTLIMSTTPFYPSFDNCDQVTPLCPASATVYGDFFNLAGCIIFVVVHTLCLGWQIVQAIRGRTISFSIFLAIGTGFEIMGYGARISMTPIGTVWNYDAFVIQLLMLILAPTLVAAAISVTFKWIVIQQGLEYSIMKPKWYPWVFVGTDFFSIVIQGIGGGISAAATSGENNNQSLLDTGSGLLVAGVAFQAANMAFCGGLMVIYYWRYRKGLQRKTEAGPRKISWRPDTYFKKYLWAITVAYIAVLIRCIYR